MATVKKKLPCELYDVAGLEDWFSQMAAEGYHLVDCWENRAEFTVATPMEGVRYRLEAQGTYEYDWNQDEAYKAGGWDHVTTIRGFFCIFRCGDPDAPELHTDPKIQSWTMRKLLRRRSFNLLVWVVYWLIQVNGTFGIRLGGFREAVGWLIRHDSLLLITGMSLILLTHFLTIQIIQLVMLIRLKRRLASGLPVDRTKHYPRSFWMHEFQWVLIGGMLLSIFVGSALYQRDPMDVDAADYPHVSLAEVIPGQYKQSFDPYYYQGAKLERSLLVPVQFTYGDRGVRNDGSEEQVRIYLNYDEAVSASAARLLLMGQMRDHARGLDTEKEWQKKYPDKFDLIVLDTGAVRTRYDGLDELWVWDIQYENSDVLYRHYFGRKGNVSFELNTALPDPEPALELLVEKIS